MCVSVLIIVVDIPNYTLTSMAEGASFALKGNARTRRLATATLEVVYAWRFEGSQATLLLKKAQDLSETAVQPSKALEELPAQSQTHPLSTALATSGDPVQGERNVLLCSRSITDPRVECSNNVAMLSEGNVLKPLDPSVWAGDTDKWPEFSLTHVKVLSQATHEPVSLLAAHGGFLVRVEGYLEEVDAANASLRTCDSAFGSSHFLIHEQS